MTFKERVNRLAKRAFTGGPVRHFERAGRLQLVTLLNEGLYPYSKVLDLGCGCLRGGYWLIHFLDTGCYCGIEPNREMLQAGIEELLEPALVEAKRPRFDYNENFDASVFGEQFDFFLARSVWTHASIDQIRLSLDSFLKSSVLDGVFITSFVPARKKLDGISVRPPEDDWQGLSHKTQTSPVLVSYPFRSIRHECIQRGLQVRRLDHGELNGQVWLRIERSGAGLQRASGKKRRAGRVARTRARERL